MKKLIISSLTATALIFSQGVQADAGQDDVAIPPSPPQTEMPISEVAPPPPPAPPPVEMPTNVVETSSAPPRQVHKIPEEEAARARRGNWGNIALAVGAVVVAIVALVLVSRNDGHHSGHHHHK